MNHNELMLLLIGIVLGMIIAMIPVSLTWEHHNTIIKQDCGQYNNKTGDFEWIKN